MSKKNSEKKNRVKLTDVLKNSDDMEQDPNIIEFEKEAQIQQELKEKENEENIELTEKPLVEPKLKQKQKKKSHKAQAIVAGFVFLLAVGVGGNWYFENSSLGEKIKPILSNDEVKTLGQAEFVDATTQLSKESEYFTKARVDRQTARDQALEKLQAVVDKTDATDQESVNATNEIAKISKYISIENKVETLVSAKGVSNCLAVVSSDGTRIDVIVDTEELTDQIIMQIKDVAMEQLGCTFEDVTIIQSK